MSDITFPLTAANRDLAIASPSQELDSQMLHYLNVSRGERKLSPTYGRRSNLFQVIGAPGIVVAAEQTGLAEFFPGVNFDITAIDKGDGRVDVQVAIVG